MKCFICNSEVNEGATFCSKCGCKISDFAEPVGRESQVLPVKWMYRFAVIPNLLFAIANVGADIFRNSTGVTEADAINDSVTWFWAMLFLSVACRFWFIGRDHFEQKMRSIPVKMWTWVGMIISPVFILGRDKWSKHTWIAMVLWVITFVVGMVSI